MLTSAIWGFAFVAQRVGMEYIGPFIFNGIRFLIGGLVLLPFIFMRRKNFQNTKYAIVPIFRREHLFAGSLAGGTLFIGASFQQIGIVYTTAAKAGFITGLYVILVPILGLLWKKRTYPAAWLGAMVAVIGLYFFSVSSEFTMAKGDFLVLISALFWALHVHLIDHFTSRMESLKLAHLQFITCGLLSLITALLVENIAFDAISRATIPILYAGLLSTGVAYTLQVVAQKEAHPTHAAILLSLESVFAGIGGWMLLKESFTPRELLGATLMLSAMFISQLGSRQVKPQKTEV